MTLAPGPKLCFLLSHMFEHAEDLLDPDLHIHYDHRVGDIEDSLPKFRNYLTSNLALTKFLMPRFLTR